MAISIKRDVLIRLEQELKAAQDLGDVPMANELRRACESARTEIKRDKDAQCSVPWLHLGSFMISANQVTASCPRCKNKTVFRTGCGWWPCSRLHMDDELYCESCDLEITGKAFAARKESQ